MNTHSFIFAKKNIFIFLFLFALALHANAQTGKTETGIASYYHDKFKGRKTATGEIFDQNKLTAAHKTLPLNTWVRVTNLSNDSSVVVRINDRLPQNSKRTIDLTTTGAKKLNYIKKGLTKVKIEIVPSPVVFNAQLEMMKSKKELVADEMPVIDVKGLKFHEQFISPKYPKIFYLIPVTKRHLNIFFIK